VIDGRSFVRLDSRVSNMFDVQWACVPRLLSGLYQLFDPCLIKHVLGAGQTINVWRPNTIKHCLVTKRANVEVSVQTVKTCLLKHGSNN